MNLAVKALDEIKNLDSRVVGTEGSTANSQTAIQNLENDVATLEADLEELQGQVDDSTYAGNIEFLQSVTGLIGGGSTNLDGVVTVGVPVPRLYFFQHTSGSVLGYLLKAGTDAEASPSIIRPDDYAAMANEKVFLAVM